MKLLITESQLKKLINENLSVENDYHDLIDVSIYFASDPKNVKYYSKTDLVKFTLKSTIQNDIFYINYQIRMKKDAVGNINVIKNSTNETDNWTVKLKNTNSSPPYNLQKGKIYNFILSQNCNSLGQYLKNKKFTMVQPSMTYWLKGGTNYSVSLNQVKISGFVEDEKNMAACKLVYGQKELLKAKNWWLQQLNQELAQRIADVNKTTLQNIQKNIFPKYRELINNLQLLYTSTNNTGENFKYPNLQDTWAFVYYELNDKNIYINCANYSLESNPVDTLIHEIQHKLTTVYQMTPSENVRAVMTPQSRFNFVDRWNNWKQNLGKTESASSGDVTKSKTPLRKTYTSYWKEKVENFTEQQKTYACAEDEQLSRIKSIQKRFKIPYGGFTTSFFVPYIKRKKYDVEIAWFLNCWALSGFKSLEKLVMDLNQNIAKNISTNTTQTTSV